MAVRILSHSGIHGVIARSDFVTHTSPTGGRVVPSLSHSLGRSDWVGHLVVGQLRVEVLKLLVGWGLLARVILKFSGRMPLDVLV